VQGRDATPSAVDRPDVVSGRWIDGPGDGVVVERAFAEALGVRVGDRVELGGRPERVVGVAVSAALPPYPQLCTIGCILDSPGWGTAQPGLVWSPRHLVHTLVTPQQPVVWFQYLTVRDPAAAPAFAARFGSSGPPDTRPALVPWQDVARRQAEQLAHERAAVVFGSSLLVVLALATLVVLVGGRMADEVRRVGLLKAAGATPGFVVRLLLGTYLAVGAVAALVGLAAGRLLTPALVSTSAGLLGHTGPTSVSVADAALVLGVLLVVVIVASLVPAWRAARTSTVRALADLGRAPRRPRLLVTLSAGLPAPMLLGVRLSGRRPRRAVLTALSVAVAVCGAVVVLYAQAGIRADGGGANGPANPQVAQLDAVTTALTLLLAAMVAVNLVFVSRAGAVDAQRVLAVARTLGISPAEAAVSLGVAQIVPAVAGLAVGWGCGVVLFHALSSHPVSPPPAQLVALAVGMVTAIVLLTAVPGRVEARRPVAETLRGA
jgi:putative ABC transport system permease protein